MDIINEIEKGLGKNKTYTLEEIKERILAFIKERNIPAWRHWRMSK